MAPPDLGMLPGPPSAASPHSARCPLQGTWRGSPAPFTCLSCAENQGDRPLPASPGTKGTKACSNLPWATRCPASHLRSAKVKPLCQPGARGKLGLRPHNLGHSTRAFTASNSSRLSREALETNLSVSGGPPPITLVAQPVSRWHNQRAG